MAGPKQILSRAVVAGSLSSLVFAGFHAIMLDQRYFEQYESFALDFDYYVRAAVAHDPTPDDRLLLVTIDAQSYEDLMQRPTAWHYYAEVLDRVAEAHPRTVFLDVLLNASALTDGYARRLREVERDANSAMTPEQAKEIAAVADDLDVESRLASAMRKVPLVLPIGCPAGMARFVETTPENDAAVARLERYSGTPPPFVQPVTRLSFPLPKYVDAAQTLASSCEHFDYDGTLRFDPTVVAVAREHERIYTPSVSSVLAARAMDLPESALKMVPGGVTVGENFIPVDQRGNSLIAWSGHEGDFRARSRARLGRPSGYTTHDILDPDFPIERLTGKVVMIGYATNRLFNDHKISSFHFDSIGGIPGVEKIAMQTDAIVRGDRFPWRPHAVTLLGTLSCILLGILGAWIGSRASAPVAGAAVVLGVPFLLLAGGLTFAWKGIWVDTFYATLAWASSVSVSAVVRYAAKEREQQFLREAFGKYLEPKMIDRLVENPDALRLFGEDRELTILFADLRGFTSASEKSTPAEIVHLLNDHLTAMSEVILENHGTLDKFVGDCVMAFWGAPMSDAEHAEHACNAAVKMLARMDAQNAERAAKGIPVVDMGVGVNTGRVIVGNMGSKHRFDYTVIGDAVNLASRLEGLTKDASSRVLIGERTAQLVKGSIAIVPLGGFSVKGKASPVPVFGLAETMKGEKASQAPTQASV